MILGRPPGKHPWITREPTPGWFGRTGASDAAMARSSADHGPVIANPVNDRAPFDRIERAVRPAPVATELSRIRPRASALTRTRSPARSQPQVAHRTPHSTSYSPRRFRPSSVNKLKSREKSGTHHTMCLPRFLPAATSGACQRARFISGGLKGHAWHDPCRSAPAVVRRSRGRFSLTRSVGEGQHLFPRLRFGLVSFRTPRSQSGPGGV
jgi:hypothetical protein